MRSLIGTFVLFATVATALGTQQFTVYSNPIVIARGQAHNSPTSVISLPDEIVNKYKGKSMGIAMFQHDIVKFDENGSEKRVPLYEAYNHHTIQAVGTKAFITVVQEQWSKSDPLGPPASQDEMPHCGRVNISATLRKAGWIGAAPKYYFGPVGGAEYRDADRELPKPYRQVVESPEAFVAILHFINVQARAGETPLFECPCTSDRVIDPSNGTIDGVKPLSFHCSQQLLDEHNGDCRLSWYKGGYRCCENKAWLTEPAHRDANTTDTFFAKFTFTIDDIEKDTQPAYFMMLDGTGGNAEYDIPKCNLSDPLMHMEGDKCIHTITYVQGIASDVPQVPLPLPWAKVALLTARGHQHKAGLGMEMYNEKTGDLICKSVPRYGNGTEAGNEKDFIVGIPPCVWGPPPLPPPPVFGLYDKVRIVSRYDATEGHHGVMALWFIQATVSAHLENDIVI